MKPSILILISHYIPGHKSGGPVRSVFNMVENLRDDFDISIITSDRDLGDDAAYSENRLDSWSQSDGASVRYISKKNQTLRGISEAIRSVPHDLIYLNSFHSPRFTILPLLARRLRMIPRRPVVLAPRGELAEGALALKRSKKLAWMKIGGSLGLFDDLIWQASSVYERADIESAMPGRLLDVAVVKNLPTLSTPSVEHQPRPTGTPLRVLFVSRISPKKNLDYALRVMSKVKSRIIFNIYGPREDISYFRLCESIVKTLPDHIKINWGHSLAPTEILDIMALNDVLFLPTRGENYGHVIVEALSVGTPVLISDRTPWRGLAARGAGHDLTLADEAAFAARIDEFASAKQESALEQRNLVRAYFREIARSHGHDVETQRALFLRAVWG